MPRYGQSGWGFGRYGFDETGPQYALSIGYYLNLLTSEYQPCPVFIGWLQTALTPLDDMSNALIEYTQAFNPDFAIGVQLDIIGLIVGQPRTVAFQPSAGVSPTLDDDTYRLLLTARIAQNGWDGKISSLQGIWRGLFPGGRIIIDDGRNMSATVIITGAFSSITQDLITHGYIVPRSEGVQYTYTIGDLPMFGFSTVNDAFIAGWDVGKWS